MKYLAYGLIAVPVVAGVCLVSGVAIEYYYVGEFRMAARIIAIRVAHVWMRYEGWTISRRHQRLRRVEQRVARWTDAL